MFQEEAVEGQCPATVQIQNYRELHNFRREEQDELEKQILGVWYPAYPGLILGIFGGLLRDFGSESDEILSLGSTVISGDLVYDLSPL